MQIRQRRRGARARIVCGHVGAEGGVHLLGDGGDSRAGPETQRDQWGVQTQREGSEHRRVIDESCIAREGGSTAGSRGEADDLEQVGSGAGDHLDLLSERNRPPETAGQSGAQPLVDRHLGCAPRERQAPGDHRHAAKRGTRVLEAHEGHACAQEAGPGRSCGDLLFVERDRLSHPREVRQRGDLGGEETGRAVHPNVERGCAGLLQLRLACLHGQALDGELHGEDDRDPERDGARGERAPQRTRPDGANRHQPEVAHRSSLASLATRSVGSGIWSGACPPWLSATSSTTTPSRMIRTRSA